MNYIVLDFEWNQSDTGKEPEVKALPFEIIDVGAVKLDNERRMTGEFNRLVRPAVYRHMHKITGKLIHLHMSDLQRGIPSPRSWRTSGHGWDRITFSVPGDRLICTSCREISLLSDGSS